MSAVSYTGPDLVVIDDLLPGPAFLALGRALATNTFRPARNYLPDGSWRQDARDPLEGPKLLRPCVALPDGVDLEVAVPGLRVYPSCTALDGAVDAIWGQAADHAALVGAPGADWIALLATAWRYRPGNSLQWHSDSHIYAGAFVLYAHAGWSRDAGGQLLVAEGQRGVAAAGERADDLRRLGLGRYVTPVPNRLVLLRGGTPHCVVGVAPGERCRETLAGFFITPAGAMQYLAALDRGGPAPHGET